LWNKLFFGKSNDWIGVTDMASFYGKKILFFERVCKKTKFPSKKIKMAEIFKMAFVLF
jgi:hypothetical protein